MTGDALRAVAQLSAGADNTEIARSLLSSALSLTGARSGAVSIDPHAPRRWETEGVDASYAERILRRVAAECGEGRTRRLGVQSPHLRAIDAHATRLLVASSRSAEDCVVSMILRDNDAGEFSAADEDIVEALTAVASVALAGVRGGRTMRRFEHWMTVIEDTATLLLNGVAPSSVLESVFESVALNALQDSAAEMAGVATPDRAGDLMTFRLSFGRQRQYFQDVAFPEDGSLTGLVARTAEPVITSDAVSDVRSYKPVCGPMDLGPTAVGPLKLMDRTIGVVFVGNVRNGQGLDMTRAIDAIRVPDLAALLRERDLAQTHMPDPQHLARFRTESRGWERLARLSEREFVMLELIAEGLTNSEIGSRMFLAEKTVRNAISGLLAKLELTNRVEAAVLLARYSERTGRLRY